MRRSVDRAGLEPSGRWLFFADDDGAVLRAGIGSGPGGRLRIGRDANRNDIYLDHPSVPAHALIVVEREGVDVVKVYEGARVALNGAVVQGMHRLYAGDRIRVGDRLFTYGRDDTPPDLAIGMTVVFGGEVVSATLLRDTRILLGRSGDLVLDDPSVLDHHAVIEAYGEDAVYVRTLDADATTWLDGSRLLGRLALVDGSVLQLGRVEVAIKILAADGLGLLAPPRRKAERTHRATGAFVPSAPSPNAEDVPAVTVIGSVSDLGLDMHAAAAHDPSEFDDNATGRYVPRDRSRPAHWSTGATPPPVAVPVAARRTPDAPPAIEQRRAPMEGPSVRVRSAQTAVPGHAPSAVAGPAVTRAPSPAAPAARVVDGSAHGGRRRQIHPEQQAPMVPTIRPGLHDAETATLDTRGVPDMIEAHFRGRGQDVPTWAKTGAHAPAPPQMIDHDAPTGDPRRDSRPSDTFRRSDAFQRPVPPAPSRASGAHEPYRPSREGGFRQTGGHVPAAGVPAPAQLTVALAPIPDAPRLPPEAPRQPPVAPRPVPAEAPVVQGYSHHDPERIAASEREAPPPLRRGPTDDAQRHHRARVIDGSKRHGPGSDGKA